MQSKALTDANVSAEAWVLENAFTGAERENGQHYWRRFKGNRKWETERWKVRKKEKGGGGQRNGDQDYCKVTELIDFSRVDAVAAQMAAQVTVVREQTRDDEKAVFFLFYLPYFTLQVTPLKEYQNVTLNGNVAPDHQTNINLHLFAAFAACPYSRLPASNRHQPSPVLTSQQLTWKECKAETMKHMTANK